MRGADASLVDALGLSIGMDDLALPRARDLASYLATGKSSFARLAELRAAREPVREAVLFEVEVERPQDLANDIRRYEPVAAVFDTADSGMPEVLSLRRDFPAVPHLNLRSAEIPRSLCLTAEPWEEVRLAWTPLAFIERIRKWLSLTAAGELHQDDQPLEPLLFAGAKMLILPKELLSADAMAPVEVLLWSCRQLDQASVIRAMPRSQGSANDGMSPAVLVRVETPAQQHGIIRRCPGDLRELDGLLRETGVDLLGGLRSKLKALDIRRLGNAKLIVLLDLPKTRTTGGPVEVHEHRAFVTMSPLADVGVEIGCLIREAGYLGPRIDGDDVAKDGAPIRITIMGVQPLFSRKSGAELNGLPGKDDRTVAAIGVGALGSQVVDNLGRAGWSRWVLVDDDFLLPHNLARHALDAFAVGLPKAEALASHLQVLTGEEAAARPIVANVLKGEKPEDLAAAFAEADVILDMAASVAVSRHLASDIASSARRVTVFLSPSGADLVLLAEDSSRSKPLDVVEMQYYRAVMTLGCLAGHLHVPSGHVRYGQSCRDVSSRMPQDLVSLHAGVAARSVRRAVDVQEACLWIWRVDPATMEVVPIDVPVSGFRTQQADGWTVHIDELVLGKLAQVREEKLPNETGGVLIGGVDLRRKTVYVMDALASPPDSVEWPGLYIRGWQGLPGELAAIEKATLDNLGYVGEWHSHPKGRGTRPSEDDVHLFGWLADEMAAICRPAIMLIVGHDGKARLFASSIPRELPEPICLS